MNASTRAGFIATFDTADGLVTLHRAGRTKTAMLAEACDEIVARWPNARLVCYSTPDTIAADLRGRRATLYRSGFPEAKALGYVKRGHLLADVLRSHPSGLEAWAS